jgi:carboxypeptidase T
MYVRPTPRVPWLAVSVALVATLVATSAGPRPEVSDMEHRTPSQLAMALAERVRLAGRASAEWFAEYRDNDEVNAYLGRLAARYPDLARVRLLGRSVEGRPIRAIEITNGGKIGIAIDGGQHAREWISVMVPVCIADRLASGYERDARIRRVIDAARFFIVPIVNPDGYHYTWTTDRYWRKNRRGGYGVDLNRNYGVGWGEAGSSDDPQSPNYRGEHPFSEPETQAVRTLFEREAIAAHVDFHSFSQVIVYPWSHRRADPPDRDKLAAIADRMSSAMSTAHGEPYAVRPGSGLRVGSGGTAGDWSYGVHGALSFLVELRPSRRADGGFLLPPEQIAPTCDESFAGLLALAEWMIEHARSTP